MFNIESLMAALLSIPGAMFAFTLKGYSQALVAKKLGDPTPEAQGKLTMNPMAHIDIVGFICIILFQFGWSKPVPTNSRYYKHVKRDKAIQILSGPVGLILGGIVMSFFAVLFSVLEFKTGNTVFTYLSQVFGYATSFPLFLATFYMLPLPGLDGYNLIANFVPYKFNRILYNIEKYSFFIFIGFIMLVNMFPMITILLYMPAMNIIRFFENLWLLCFGFLL